MTITDPEKQADALAQIAEAKAMVARPAHPVAPASTVGTFLAGIALALVGGYLVLNQVQVTSSSSLFGLGIGSGPLGFALVLLPLLVGIGTLFFDGKSRLGWFLSIGGALTLVTAVLASLSVRWEPTSLFNTIAMFGLMAGGIGLVLRSLRPEPPPQPSSNEAAS